MTMIEQKITFQLIKSPRGDDMVVIPKKDYDKLIDEITDLRGTKRAEAVIAKMATSGDDFVPADVAAAIADGGNKVRVWRKHRGMTARALSVETGFPASYLSEIETGKKAGSLAAIKAIAEALNIPLDYLV